MAKSVVQTRPAEAGAVLNFNISHVMFAAFLALNALKIALFNYYLISEPTADTFIYKLIMTLLTIIIVYPLIYRMRSRLVLGALYVLQALYILVNLGYYDYFRNYLNILQYFSLIKEAFSVAGNSAVPLDIRMLTVLIDLPFFIYILITCKRPCKPKIRLSKPIIAAMLCSVLIISSIEAYNYVNNNSITNMVADTFSGESPIVERYGTIANNLVSITHNSNSAALANQLKYGRELSAKAASTAKPNYIMIQVESMDANIVNQTYKGQYITPFLHSLESESIYYPYTLSYHEGGGTSDSEFSVLNSVEPLTFYPALKLSGYDYPNSMVARLGKGDYTTLAFHGNVGSFYNRDVAFAKLGYMDFYDMLKMKLPESGWGVPDDKVLSFAYDKLKTTKGPFFAHVITMTSHEPFNSARNYYNNTLYDDIGDNTVKEYYNSMSYVDKSIQDFVDKIKAEFKDTYIIIYGDHTPNINSQIYKQASFTMDGKYFEFVPMMVVTPDGKARKETKEVASFLDVAPTVLKTSGIGYSYKSDGFDLTEPTLESGNLPFKSGSYDRGLLFQNASATVSQ